MYICFFSVSLDNSYTVLSIKCKGNDKSFSSAHSEGVWENGGRASLILKLNTRWRCVAIVMHWPLYQWGRDLWYRLNKRPEGPQSSCGRPCEKKVSCPFWELNHNSLNSIKCGQTEPVFYHHGTTAALSYIKACTTGMCRDSCGVLDSHERNSLHFYDSSNGVNAEYC